MSFHKKATAWAILGMLCALLSRAEAATSEIVLKPGNYSTPEIRTAAIQSAIDSLKGKGGTIYLAAGLWLLKGVIGNVAFDLTKSCSNIRFRGDGEATLITQDTTFTLNSTILRDSIKVSDSSKFRRDTIPLSTSIFHINDAQGITFQDLRFEGPRVRLLFPDTTPEGDTVYHSLGDSVYHTAIQVDAGSGIHVLRCVFRGFKTGGIKYHGVDFSDVLDCTFDSVDNRFDSVGGDYGAIQLEHSNDILIRGNLFRGLRFSGISASDTSARVRILDNNMRFAMNPLDIGGMGIFTTEGIKDCLIAGNQIYGPNNEAIDIRAKKSQGIQAEGNIISGNILEAKFVALALNNYDPLKDVNHQDSWNNVVQGNILSGRTTESGVERASHGMLSNLCRGSVIVANISNRSDYGINLQESPNENIVTGNLVSDASQTAISSPWSAIVSRNLIRACGLGILIADAVNNKGTHTSVVGNFLPGTSVRYQGINVVGAVVQDNCDENGICN
jgi:hypothetical protein